MVKPLLYVLLGPTASGKTELSIRLAEHIPLTILSADSRQIYRHLDIGTAKPTRAERDRVPHRFIDILDPDEEYSAGDFGAEALKEVNAVIAEGRLPLIVGGSGLYIKALTEGIASLPGKDEHVRSTLEERLVLEGEDSLRSELRAIDPSVERAIEAGKPRRVIRALEVYYLTGEPLSVHHERQSADRPFRVVRFGLSVPRAELYERINRRAIRMVASGLVDETRNVLGMGVPRSAQSLNTVGYKEAIGYIDGELSEERMIDLMQQSTRRYAKRQQTWFRGEEEVEWIEAGDDRPGDSILEDALRCLRRNA